MLDVKRGLMWSGVGAMTVSAVFAAFLFLFGTFGEAETKLVLSTLVIGYYTLVSSIVYEFGAKNIPVLMGAGIAVSLVGALLWLYLIWFEKIFLSASDFEVRTAIILAVISFSFAHSALLLKAYPAHKVVNSIVFGTIAIITVAAFMFIHLILSDFEGFGEMYFRILAALGVFNVLGTALVPIVKKLTSNTNTAAPTA